MEQKKHMILKVNNQRVQKKILGMKLVTHPVVKLWRCRLPVDQSSDCCKINLLTLSQTDHKRFKVQFKEEQRPREAFIIPFHSQVKQLSQTNLKLNEQVPLKSMQKVHIQVQRLAHRTCARNEIAFSCLSSLQLQKYRDTFFFSIQQINRKKYSVMLNHPTIFPLPTQSGVLKCRPIFK